jgi:hypothetical protein
MYDHRVYTYESINTGGCPAVASRCNQFAELDPFSKTDGPELIADCAVRFDRIAPLKQPSQGFDGISVLWLFALTGRTRRCEDDDLAHGAAKLRLPWPGSYRGISCAHVGGLPTSLRTVSCD